jgi:hypothetical protein
MVSNDVVQELSDVTSLADEADARRFLLEHEGVWLRRSDEVPVVPWRSKKQAYFEGEYGWIPSGYD